MAPLLTTLARRCVTQARHRYTGTATHRLRLSSPLGLSLRRYTTAREDLYPAGASTAEFQLEFKKAYKTRHKERHQHEREPNTATDGPQSEWIITAGLEIHAQLNTGRKLFSNARTTHTAPPNTHIAPLDASLPGSLPIFNPAVLLPALRAAVALNCTVPPESRFDRKHYFYWDQPAGYQLTQFHAPLATDGHLLLFPHDGVTHTHSGNGNSVRIDIQQIQLEQDTGKTLASPPNSLVDLNRVGSPLVEIITRPFDCPDAAFPALVMRKIQSALKAVDACTIGMEWGGLRADVNVSVRRRSTTDEDDWGAPPRYGQRCEIKNVASLKAVQEAVESEARRQIALLEAGETVQGETRGWDADKGVTRRLRGKEGEVDYRFMPDPDLPPVHVGKALLDKVKQTIPLLPDQLLAQLTGAPHHLKEKDAKTLMLWDEYRASAREAGVVYYYKDAVRRLLDMVVREAERERMGLQEEFGAVVGNWVVHELGGGLAKEGIAWRENPVSSKQLAELVLFVVMREITGATAKTLLTRLITAPSPDPNFIRTTVAAEGLAVVAVPEDQILDIAEDVMLPESDVLEELRGGRAIPKRQKRLKSWFVGRIMARYRPSTTTTTLNAYI
ncbi:hypothetical protein P167DRAFT_557395 [Morchella conica CCBAS932]|uniref:Glutamyl-tRNA(Gln) amidotransferase subunit B, mitochondrial n=1 Tax=Morchella conica CCBAS932 TaxID=1392247 RepID=A0A3N4L0X0_9PEZI|nr:hypothetical protein P167DRAFT_557395 [Morchella conica CCBAS932]